MQWLEEEKEKEKLKRQKVSFNFAELFCFPTVYFNRPLNFTSWVALLYVCVINMCWTIMFEML